VPELTAEEVINEQGEVVSFAAFGEAVDAAAQEETVEPVPGDEGAAEPRKFYVDGVEVKVIHEIVQELDLQGQQLRVRCFDDYTSEQVRTLYGSAGKIRSAWRDPERRAELIADLEGRGISFEQLAEALAQPSADPFSLLIDT
jgi:type I restriction enzyme R subunit